MEPGAAKKKLGRHIRGIDNIVKVHPHLSDTFKLTVLDTVYIPDQKDTIEVIIGADSAAVDSLLDLNYQMRTELADLLMSLDSGKLLSAEAILIAEHRIAELKRALAGQIKTVIQTVYKDTTVSKVSEVIVKHGEDSYTLRDSIAVKIHNGKVTIFRNIEGLTIPIKTEVDQALFEVTVLDMPIKIKKWYIVVGIIVVVLLVLVKFLKPF